MARFILSSVGTKGDLFPMLSLAEQLCRRGHSAIVLGTEAGRARAAQFGVPFESISQAQTNNLVSLEGNLERHVVPSYKATARIFEREMSRGCQPIVVNRGPLSGSCVLAEKYRLSQVRVVLAPFDIRSLVAPPSPWRESCRGVVGKSYQRYRVPKNYEAFECHPVVIRVVNEFRVACGLGRVRSIREHERGYVSQMGLFPEWFAPPASDWPKIALMGFPLPEESNPLPRDVQKFIERCGPPLVFTPGTGVVDVQAFYSAAEECCERTKLPGLFLSQQSVRVANPDAQLLRKAFVPLGGLLKHCRLLVHHGGVGTTARAFEAGLPQVISPQAYDQPDNGRLVRELGLGEVVPRWALTGEKLATAVGNLLQDGETQRRLRVLASSVRASDALGRAAERLGRLSENAPN